MPRPEIPTRTVLFDGRSYEVPTRRQDLVARLDALAAEGMAQVLSLRPRPGSTTLHVDDTIEAEEIVRGIVLERSLLRSEIAQDELPRDQALDCWRVYVCPGWLASGKRPTLLSPTPVGRRAHDMRPVERHERAECPRTVSTPRPIRCAGAVSTPQPTSRDCASTSTEQSTARTAPRSPGVTTATSALPPAAWCAVLARVTLHPPVLWSPVDMLDPHSVVRGSAVTIRELWVSRHAERFTVNALGMRYKGCRVHRVEGDLLSIARDLIDGPG